MQKLQKKKVFNVVVKRAIAYAIVDVIINVNVLNMSDVDVDININIFSRGVWKYSWSNYALDQIRSDPIEKADQTKTQNETIALILAGNISRKVFPK